MWILTLEEFDELALDGITIPHGQWTIALVLSHWLRKNFMNLNLELFVIHQTCCNTYCQRISIVRIILWIWYLTIFMDFYILDENFIEFLSYIDIDHTGIIPMWEWYVPSGFFYHKLYNWGRKMFLVLMTRRGNIFGHRWCNAMIVWFVLPLSFFLWIWVNNWAYLIIS